MSIYDDLANIYYKRNLENEDYQEKVLKPFINRLTLNKKTFPKVLDVGSGVGLDAKIMSKHKILVTGIDSSVQMVIKAGIMNKSSKLKPKFMWGNFFKTWYTYKFDGVVLDAFIHLFPKREMNYLFDCVKQILKPKGLIFVSTTLHKETREGIFPKKDYPTAPRRFRHFYTQDELQIMFSVFALDIVEVYTDYNRKTRKNWINYILRVK